jgi:catechol 2,3-dioxygenase-like lactoylglutathione lyase family enzyme
MKPTSFDHVALWVSQRDAIASFLYEHTGVHEIEKTDTFTLLGADARQGKLTLFDADGPRDAGALTRIVLRVSDLDAALAKLPDDVDIGREGDVAGFTGPEGISLGLTERETDLEYDLDHVVLAVPDPDSATAGFEALGFERHGGTLAVDDRELRLIGGGRGEPDRSTTLRCWSTPQTTWRMRRASAGSRSPRSRTRRTRSRSSSGAPIQ